MVKFRGPLGKTAHCQRSGQRLQLAARVHALHDLFVGQSTRAQVFNDRVAVRAPSRACLTARRSGAHVRPVVVRVDHGMVAAAVAPRGHAILVAVVATFDSASHPLTIAPCPRPVDIISLEGEAGALQIFDRVEVTNDIAGPATYGYNS